VRRAGRRQEKNTAKAKPGGGVCHYFIRIKRQKPFLAKTQKRSMENFGRFLANCLKTHFPNSIEFNFKRLY